MLSCFQSKYHGSLSCLSSPTPHFKRSWLLRQESEDSTGVVSGKEKNRKISGCSGESGWDPTLDTQLGNRRVSPDSF